MYLKTLCSMYPACALCGLLGRSPRCGQVLLSAVANFTRAVFESLLSPENKVVVRYSGC